MLESRHGRDWLRPPIRINPRFHKEKCYPCMFTLPQRSANALTKEILSDMKGGFTLLELRGKQDESSDPEIF
jgi:hypothetical protein